MTIHVVRFQHRDRIHWGVLRERRITPIPENFVTTGDLIRRTAGSEFAQLEGDTVGLEDVAILSPVTPNQQFVCQGVNYRQHMIESGVDPDAKTFNMIFTKAPSCIVPADSNVIRPRSVRFLDYEIELGLILRRAIRGPVDVTDRNLHEFVAGAVIVNDYSARDVQIPEMQFYKGKSFRTFGPVGPYLALLDASDIGLLRELRLTLTVNGEVRQDDTTSNLIYGPAETLTELSRVQDFEAGDLLSTGTPAGCALAVPSPAKQRLAVLLPEKTKWKIFMSMQTKRTGYLKPGDLVEARIRTTDGRIDLGVQRNRIVAEP
jgi:2-keto-4-pentenoate hydratase/2-oxohepta-3-ene-1,7-dioic acid hydratase in catechol pathway